MTKARGRTKYQPSMPTEPSKTAELVSIPNRLLRLVIGVFLVLGLSPVMLAAASLGAEPAFAVTKDELDDAQARYEEVQKQLDALVDEYQAMSIALSNTKDKIEATEKEIAVLESEIEVKEAELAKHQEQLAAFAVDNYKNGQTDYLDVLLASSTFENFISNLYYVGKINAQKIALIDTVRDLKTELEDHRNQLESDLANLEALQDEQMEQLDSMQAKQAEVNELLDSLDEEVKALTEKYNEELVARANAEAALRSGVMPEGMVNTGSGTLSDLIAACYSTPSPGANLCAGWVSRVFYNAGFGYPGGNACDQYARWCNSSDRDELKPGMIIAVSSSPYGSMGRMYGHVGIYIGDNTVIHNVGSIQSTTVDAWIQSFGGLVTVRWGWVYGQALC